MNLKEKLGVILWAMLLFGSMNCTNKDSDLLKSYYSKYSDTLTKVPWSSYNDSSRRYRYLTKLAVGLQLDQIQSGYDGLQIRIWLEYKTSKRHLVIIKLTKQESSVSLLVRENSDDSNALYQQVTSKTTITTEKVKVEGILKTLDSLGIFTLPDYSQIPGVPMFVEPVTYQVEIALKNKYRLYEYESPEQLKDKFWQCANFEKILIYLEKELNFQRNLKY